MSPANLPHQGLEVSPWVVRWLALAAPGSSVLDVACGAGRHSRLAAGQGHRVVALDKDADALAGLESLSGVRILKADIETGEWPLTGEQFDVVIVTNYLHRPLFEVLLQSLSETGTSDLRDVRTRQRTFWSAVKSRFPARAWRVVRSRSADAAGVGL